MKKIIKPIKEALKQPEAIKYQVVRPFQLMLQSSLASTVLLVIATALALAWANSSFHELYYHFRETLVSFSIGGFKVTKELSHWVDEGLMSLFFFVVGLEIKKEMMVGELNTRAKAMLPIWAAIGGMVCPALVYVLFNYGEPSSGGWGIPMATDIAFALGAIHLLGKRVPIGLKVFLSAFAIADDLGAVFVIALFYTKDIVVENLLVSVIIIICIAIMNFFWVRKTLPYALLGILLWFFILGSGVHATVAGILVAMFIPAKGKYETERFIERVSAQLYEFRCPLDGCGYSILLNEQHQQAVLDIERACHDVETPLQRISNALHPWVSFVVLPLFAFMNAGVVINAESLAGAFSSTLTMGVVFGLVAGKPLGIILFSFIAVRSGLAALPEGVRWKHVFGAGILGGIGFTMSLFISGLSFEGMALAEQARMGIMMGSLVSGILGLVYLYVVTGAEGLKREDPGP